MKRSSLVWIVSMFIIFFTVVMMTAGAVEQSPYAPIKVLFLALVVMAGIAFYKAIDAIIADD